MEYHFATTCLPTYEAWFFHNLPPWALRLSTAITFFSGLYQSAPQTQLSRYCCAEIPAVFLFVLPFATVRQVSVVLQVTLMGVIMLSGNYNWFVAILTIVLAR